MAIDGDKIADNNYRRVARLIPEEGGWRLINLVGIIKPKVQQRRFYD